MPDASNRRVCPIHGRIWVRERESERAREPSGMRGAEEGREQRRIARSRVPRADSSRAKKSKTKPTPGRSAQGARPTDATDIRASRKRNETERAGARACRATSKWKSGARSTKVAPIDRRRMDLSSRYLPRELRIIIVGEIFMTLDAAGFRRRSQRPDTFRSSEFGESLE